MKARIMSTELRSEVLAVLKKSRVGMTSSQIHEAVNLGVALPRVTAALNELRKEGIVSGDQNRPRAWFFAQNKPYAPAYISTPRVKRFDWTHETYVPPPQPALRPHSMDFKNCPSVGAP